MTAALAIVHYEGRYDTSVTINGDWIEGVSGITAKFKAGETVEAERIISALIIGSGNDAAYILANAIAGSTEAFVEMMNQKAAELGMEDTHYTNPAGTDDNGMYTSVNDVVKISRYASSLSKLTEISDQPSVAIPATNKSDARTIYNRNYFVSNYYNLRYLMPSVFGLNSGMSANAGWCLSVLGRSSAGLTYVIVVMGARDPVLAEDEEPEEFFISGYEDALLLLDWAYKSFGYFTIADTSTMICEVPVELSNKTDHVILLPETKIVSFLPLDTNTETDIKKSWSLKQDVLYAPISQGQVVGELTVSVNDTEIAKVNLIARNNVDRSNWLMIWSKIEAFIKTPVAIAIGGAVLLAAVLYVILKARSIAKKRQIVRYKDR